MRAPFASALAGTVLLGFALTGLAGCQPDPTAPAAPDPVWTDSAAVAPAPHSDSLGSSLQPPTSLAPPSDLGPPGDLVPDATIQP